jgi:hypothetical protein
MTDSERQALIEAGKHIEFGYAFHNTLGWYVYGRDNSTGTEWQVPGYIKGTIGSRSCRALAAVYQTNVRAGRAFDSTETWGK